jgi:hypothetical protein
MKRAFASIRFSPGGQAAAGIPSRQVTDYLHDLDQISDTSFSRFALHRCDQVRPSSPPPLSTVTPQPISKLLGSRSRGPRVQSEPPAHADDLALAANAAGSPALGGRFSYRLVELYAAGVMISELVYSRTQVEIVGCPVACHTRKRGERHVPWRVPSS